MQKKADFQFIVFIPKTIAVAYRRPLDDLAETVHTTNKTANRRDPQTKNATNPLRRTSAEVLTENWWRSS
jgi:hypothetical protein